MRITCVLLRFRRAKTPKMEVKGSILMIFDHFIKISSIFEQRKMQNNGPGLRNNGNCTSTRARDFEATCAHLKSLSNTFWAKSIEELYHFRKSAHVDDATSRSAPLDDSNGQERPQKSDFGPKRKNQKTIENQLIFTFFGFKRTIMRCRKIVDIETKSLKINWFYSVF